MFVLIIFSMSCFRLSISIFLDWKVEKLAGFIPVSPPGGVTTYVTLVHISSITSSIKSNTPSNNSPNSSPNTAGWVGSVSSNSKPK